MKKTLFIAMFILVGCASSSDEGTQTTTSNLDSSCNEKIAAATDKALDCVREASHNPELTDEEHEAAVEKCNSAFKAAITACKASDD